MNIESLKQEIFKINTPERFDELCIEVFKYQATNNKVYKEYLELLEIDPTTITTPNMIPCLPIKFFKSREVLSGDKKPEIVFTSSATTGMVPSRHPVLEKSIYEKSFIEGFKLFYGEPSNYTILALLPSYLEREGSSLVYMADKLIKMSGKTQSGFYLYNHSELAQTLQELKERGEKTILLGVSFALLDFTAQYSIEFPELIVIETGGMKGRGEELTRETLHAKISEGFSSKNIHSEYGMAELLSQAYSTQIGVITDSELDNRVANMKASSSQIGVFATPPWMKIAVRNLYNPFEYYPNATHPTPLGGINIIDLANINSCSFIETEDMGKLYPDNTFTIEGRIKESELRGCNMLLEK